MRKILEGFGEVGVVNETNGSGLDFVEKIESGYRRATPNMGVV